VVLVSCACIYCIIFKASFSVINIPSGEPLLIASLIGGLVGVEGLGTAGLFALVLWGFLITLFCGVLLPLSGLPAVVSWVIAVSATELSGA
jgi:hypothetical protein